MPSLEQAQRRESSGSNTMANPFDQFDDGATAVMDAPPSATGNPFDAFDDAPTEPNPFDQFDAEPASAPTSIESQ